MVGAAEQFSRQIQNFSDEQKVTIFRDDSQNKNMQISICSGGWARNQRMKGWDFDMSIGNGRYCRESVSWFSRLIIYVTSLLSNQDTWNYISEHMWIYPLVDRRGVNIRIAFQYMIVTVSKSMQSPNVIPALDERLCWILSLNIYTIILECNRCVIFGLVNAIEPKSFNDNIVATKHFIGQCDGPGTPMVLIWSLVGNGHGTEATHTAQRSVNCAVGYRIAREQILGRLKVLSSDDNGLSPDRRGWVSIGKGADRLIVALLLWGYMADNDRANSNSTQALSAVRGDQRRFDCFFITITS